MEDDNTEAITPNTVKVWAVIAFLISLPVAEFVEHYYGPGRGRVAGVAFGLMILTGRAFWYLRRRVWFWLTVAALLLIHVVLVAVVSWTNKSLPAPALWFVGIIDFVAMCGGIKLVEKLITSESVGTTAPHP
jgi:hypothetical protein